jgi:hypothetical protein
MAWKEPDYKKIAEAQDMGLEVFASGLWLAIAVAGVVIIIAGGAIYVASGLMSVQESLTPEQIHYYENLYGPMN